MIAPIEKGVGGEREGEREREGGGGVHHYWGIMSRRKTKKGVGFLQGWLSLGGIADEEAREKEQGQIDR